MLKREVPVREATSPSWIGWVVLVFGGSAIVVQSLESHARYACRESKGDIARATARKYALEAYPSWAEGRDPHACPRSLGELNAYMNTKDTRDPWGGEYQFACVDREPPVPRLFVWSAGEDGKLGTADDIHSWF